MTNPQQLPVAVIGAGAGGLPAATALAEAGIPIVLIEQGGEMSANSYLTNQYNYEELSRPWEVENDPWQGPVKTQRGIGLGGSTLYFQGVSHIPDDSVLQQWGLPVEIIKSINKDITNFLQIAGEIQPPHPLNPVSSQLFQAAKNLNWKTREAPVAILSKSHQGRPACNHCGLCIYGCRPGDKSSADKTWLPRLRKNHQLDILTHTRVDSIQLESKVHVKSLKLTGPEGSYTLPVKAIVVSAGALETPFLLKSSQQKLAPKGIGNKNVGRYLTGTLWHSLLIAQNKSSGGGYAGIPTDILIEEFEQQGILLIQSRNMSGITGPVAAAKYYSRHLGNSDCRKWMRFYYPRLASITAMAESSTSFNEGIIDFSLKNFHKKINDEDKKMIINMKRHLYQWGQSAKSEYLSETGSLKHNITGSMLRGTCRMGLDPETTSVLPDGRLHGFDNIVISDASVLGRGLIADPSLILQTLGFYFGQQLADRLKHK